MTLLSLFTLQISLITMITFLMLIQTRIANLVILLIFQNIVLTSYLICKAWVFPNAELIISLIFTFLIKVFVLPWGIWKFVNYLKLTQRIEPILNRPTLQCAGLLLTAFSLFISHQIETVIGPHAIAGFSLSLANIMLALLLIIFRKKAISQVIGLLVMENSIFILTTNLTNGFPWLIELGVSFDILIGFMIFGLFLLRIRSTYGSLHLQNLEKLKERF